MASRLQVHIWMHICITYVVESIPGIARITAEHLAWGFGLGGWGITRSTLLMRLMCTGARLGFDTQGHAREARSFHDLAVTSSILLHSRADFFPSQNACFLASPRLVHPHTFSKGRTHTTTSIPTVYNLAITHCLFRIHCCSHKAVQAEK